MTTRDEKNRRAYERFYRVEGSLAPRNRPTVAPVEQETRRLSGLAFAPDEGKRSAYYALEILDELCKELRSET